MYLIKPVLEMSCCIPTFFNPFLFSLGKDYLQNTTYENTIPFIPPVSKGKVVKVYDGDTITVASKILGSKKIYRFSVRLNGIDAPEIKGKTQEEKNAAIISRDVLREKILGEIVLLKDVKTEKYGRLLATVYLNNINMNEWMLTNNYAIPYDGGKKTDFEDFHKS